MAGNYGEDMDEAGPPFLDQEIRYEGRCLECGPSRYQTTRHFCPNRHEYCDFCFENIVKLVGCLRCRNPYGLEEDSCPNKTRGCDYVRKENDKDEVDFRMHSDGCKLRLLKCECDIFGIVRCSWYGDVFNIVNHFKNDHPQMLGRVSTETETTLPINLEKSHRSLHLVTFRDEVFFYKHSLDLEVKKFYVVVQMIGPKDHANHFFYDYKIKKGSSTQIGMCHSDSRPYDEICQKEKCVVIPLKKLTEYVVDGNLTFEFKITTL